MKTLTLIITVALALTAGVLSASTFHPIVPASKTVTELTLMKLAPVAPLEAPFDDALLTPGYSTLAPVVPMEAPFDEGETYMPVPNNLAPVIPAVADFDDDPATVTVDLKALAPVVPLEADFE